MIEMEQKLEIVGNTKENKTYMKYIYLIFLLFMYSFTYSMIYSYFNERSLVLLSEASSFLHYRLIQLSFSTGLIIFGLFVSLTKLSDNIIGRICGVITLLCAPIILLIFYTNNPTLFLISIYIVTFLIGIECVYINYTIVRYAASLKRIGLINGLSLSFSICIQYFLQSGRENLIIYFLIIFCFISSFMYFSKGIPANNDDFEEITFNHTSFSVILCTTLAIIILLEILGNFLTYSLILALSQGNAIVFGSPRLFMMFAYLFMGFIADIKDMKYIPIVTFAGVLIGILNPVLIHEGPYTYLNTCIFYVIAGIINSFFVLMVWKLAKGHRFAALIAVSGRFIDSIFSLLFVSPIISNMSLFAAIVVELIVIIGIMLLFVFSGQFSFIPHTHIVVDNLSPAVFAREYGFSDKETEVFIASLNHTGSISELADNLFISRSVLYKYFQKIQEKTGQSSYQGVKKLYYSTKISNKLSHDESIPPIDTNTTETTAVQKTEISDKSENTETETKNSLEEFANKYSLNENEKESLKLLIDNPHKTQKELAELKGVTLRTMQRYLASLRAKTGVNSLSELVSKLK